MKQDKKEYILCSAIRKINPHEGRMIYYEQYSDIYNVELGWRHADILDKFRGVVSRKPKDQGFYTSKGRFVERDEALQIAIDSEQVIPGETYNSKLLYSEDLY